MSTDKYHAQHLLPPASVALPLYSSHGQTVPLRTVFQPPINSSHRLTGAYCRVDPESLCPIFLQANVVKYPSPAPSRCDMDSLDSILI
jgi:hypothetical protein